MPFKEQDVYWISNDGTDEINFSYCISFQALGNILLKTVLGFAYEIKDWSKQDSLLIIAVQDHYVCWKGKKRC
jgi:hypothetical protein